MATQALGLCGGEGFTWVFRVGLWSWGRERAGLLAGLTSRGARGWSHLQSFFTCAVATPGGVGTLGVAVPRGRW